MHSNTTLLLTPEYADSAVASSIASAPPIELLGVAKPSVGTPSGEGAALSYRSTELKDQRKKLPKRV